MNALEKDTDQFLSFKAYFRTKIPVGLRYRRTSRFYINIINLHC